MKILPDGSLLIRAAIDGPFEPLEQSVKVKGVENPNRTVIDSITSGRPSTHNRQQRIKDLIHQMQVLKPQLTFVQCWDILHRERTGAVRQALCLEVGKLMQITPETLKRLVEMAGIGCTPNEIQHALNLTLTPELQTLIQQVRAKPLQTLPKPSASQIRYQSYLNRRFRPPEGCDPYN